MDGNKTSQKFILKEVIGSNIFREKLKSGKNKKGSINKIKASLFSDVFYLGGLGNIFYELGGVVIIFECLTLSFFRRFWSQPLIKFCTLNRLQCPPLN
jgi:hypothetical protein